MQADAIPDWFVYIICTPFIPLTGAIHIALFVIQCGAIFFAILKVRSILSDKNMELRKRLIKTSVWYIVTMVLPNIVVVIWGIMTDPAL